MMLLNRSQILEADDRPTLDVEVPEWGGTVRLKALRLEDLVKFQAARKTASDAEVLAWLVAYSAVDEAGAPVFSEADVANLIRKSTPTIKRLSDRVLALNGMDEGSDEARVKNS